MNTLPIYIAILMALTVLLTLFFLYQATRKSKTVLVIVTIWLAVQGIIGWSGFYLDTKGMPPRFMLGIIPPIVTILFMMLTKTGRTLIDRLNVKYLTYLHMVRFPVELCLLFLFLHQQVPQIMTFEGRNFDILSGITAPIVAFLYFNKGKIGPKLMLAWNFVCLVLVLNITVHGILSAPFDYQQFGFEQPNVGVLKFPFVWLPVFIVPVVILSHLVCIRNIMKKSLTTETFGIEKKVSGI